MKKFELIILVMVGLSVSLLLSIGNLYYSKDNTDTFHGPYGYQSKSYATVKRCANVIKACCYAMGCICAPLGIAAMPFSLVGDTLLLPYTVGSDSRNNEIKSECAEYKHKQTIEAQKKGERWVDDDVWCTKFQANSANVDQNDKGVR